MSVVVVLLAASFIPQSAEARPRLDKIFSVLTNPVGAILGAGRHAGRRSAHHRRSYAGRSRSRAAVAASHSRAPAVAAASVAAGATAAAASAAPAPPGAVTRWPENVEQPQTSPATGEPSDAKATPPTPAPIQRTASAGQDESAPIPSAGTNARGMGMVGPAAWPTAFEDVIGYALWPKDYGERLRAHGIGDVLATAFTPGAALVARARPNRTKEARSTVGSGGGGDSSICSTTVAASADWPAAEIERTLTLNDAQRGTLDELKTAIANAGARVRLTCRDDAAPVDRLRAMQNTLWAVHDAAQTIRAPLAKFYDQLSDEQKRQFAPPVQAQADTRTASRSELMKMCGAPGNELPKQTTEQLHPTQPQRASLDTLQKKSFEMGQFLMASCLKPVPATPAERLDAAADRLTAVIFAASNVNMALNDFTSQLSAEQKAKLNALGR
jgi:hypothetical protein